MDSLELSLKNAIKVIKAAKKLGVIRMKIGTLEFELSKEEFEPRVKVRPTLKVSAKKIAEQDSKNQLQINFSDAREELSVMHLDDPSGFERALVQHELADDDEGIIEQYEIEN